MDLTTKEFTLNFRGFEQDDPETVRRFTAFCEANFAISPDALGDPGSCANAVVLTHGESPEALEALAKVLREIGARVDVSKDCRIEEHAALEGPSSQDLHRLFGHHLESEGANDAGPSCPYPPLGRTLYLLNGSDHVLDRRRLRTTAHSVGTSEAARVKESRRRATLVAVSVMSIGIGILALIAATLLTKRTPVLLNEREQRSSFQSRELAQNTRNESSGRETQPAKSFTASTHAHGFSVDLKVLASSRSLSISSLTLLPDADTRMSDGSRITRVAGDPTFLSKSSPGEWSGRVQLSVFFDIGGSQSHITMPAQVSVRMRDDTTAGSASISLGDATVNDMANGPSGSRSQATDRLGSVSISNLSLF